MDGTAAQAPVVVADLGGTSLRVALHHGGALHHAARVDTAALSPDAAPWLRAWMARLPVRPAAACVAVAGPVDGDRVELTNARVALAAGDLPLPTALVNDLHGAAMGVDRVRPEQVVHLGGPPPRPGGPLCVLGVGTGLGQAVRLGEVVLPGEGGHAAYAPVDEDGLALHAWLLRQHGDTEWEDVACGTALGGLLRHARERRGTTPALEARLRTGEPAAATVLALAEVDPACALALDLHLAALGTEAGNAALRHLATGGVWLIGGVAARLRPWLARPDGAFARAYGRRRGRYAGLVAELPRLLVLDDDVGLLGAAVVARRLLAERG